MGTKVVVGIYLQSMFKKTKGPLLLLCVWDIMKYMMEKMYTLYTRFIRRASIFFTRFPSFEAQQ